MSKVKELIWINNVRAICILFVYWAHAEAYYGVSLWGNRLYVPFYVNVFYIVSGYLLFSKAFQIKEDRNYWIFVKKTVQNIFFRIVVPTVLFTAIFQYPKSIFNKNTFSLGVFLINTIF